jgi:hypothetical protein
VGRCPGGVTLGDAIDHIRRHSMMRKYLAAGALGASLLGPPDFAVEDSGQTLVVQTEVGEVRLPRVDSVPVVD